MQSRRCKSIIKKAINKWGTIDILFNNVGVSDGRNVWDETEKQLFFQIRNNKKNDDQPYIGKISRS